LQPRLPGDRSAETEPGFRRWTTMAKKPREKGLDPGSGPGRRGSRRL